MSVKRNEHFLFLSYSKEIKKFLENNMHLSAYPDDMNVGVFYATPPRAFVRFIVPVINGANLNPTVTFTLSNFETKQEEMPGGFTYKTIQSDNDPDEFNKIKHPLVYELTYRVTVWTARQADADILTYQAITAAPFNRPYAKKIDDQWATVVSSNFNNETNLDPGDAQDVSHRFGFDLKVHRAYLPLDYETFIGRIQKYNIDFEMDF